MSFGNILNPEIDRIIYEIPLNVDNDLHTVCAVVRSRDIKKVLESNSDLVLLFRRSLLGKEKCKILIPNLY